MAPEVDNVHEYSNKCDIWGLGVLLYILLSKNVPFSISHYNRIVNGIEKCEVQFNCEVWRKHSDAVKKLIQRMIILNPQQRISIEELNDHKWLSYVKSDSTMSDEHQSIEDSLYSILEFESIPLLKHAVLRSLVTLIPKEKLTQFQNEFSSLDEDKDGRLSFSDLKRSLRIIGLKKVSYIINILYLIFPSFSPSLIIYIEQRSAENNR